MGVQHREYAFDQRGGGGAHICQRRLGSVRRKALRAEEGKKRRVDVAGEESFPVVEFVDFAGVIRLRSEGLLRPPGRVA